MMHSIDASGAIVSVNMRWITKLGYERSEVIGGLAERIFAPESKCLADVEMLAREESEGFRERECLLLTRDGRAASRPASSATMRAAWRARIFC